MPAWPTLSCYTSAIAWSALDIFLFKFPHDHDWTEIVLGTSDNLAVKLATSGFPLIEATTEKYNNVQRNEDAIEQVEK